MQSWPLPKDPDEVLDYQFNWADRLEAGEQIATSDIISTGSVVIATDPAPSVSGALVTFWATGGTPGEACEITNRITTNQGRTYDNTARLRIREL